MSQITFQRCPVVNGKAYASMSEFKHDAITNLVRSYEQPEKKDYWTAEGIASIVVDHAQEIVDILTLNEKSRPQTRKAKTEKRQRKKDKTPPLPMENNPVKEVA